MNKEKFGAFVAESRKAKDMTQKDLAKSLHITDKAVSKWERGLSYPDVTLLEPLAQTLGMDVGELMSCQRQAEKQEDDGMKSLLEISNDSLWRERRRSRFHAACVIALVLVSALAVLYSTITVTEQRHDNIFLKEVAGNTNYIYVEEEGHLLKLECGKNVDFDAIELTNEWGDKPVYLLNCQWNQWTHTGTVTDCQDTNSTFLGSLMDVTFETERTQLFDYDLVYFTSENYYPNPYGEPHSYLCDFRFWVKQPSSGEEQQTILLVEDCMNAVVVNLDGDGENEVVVRTRWPEKPYAVYDWMDGEIITYWPDAIQEEIAEKLVCIWEQ